MMKSNGAMDPNSVQRMAAMMKSLSQKMGQGMSPGQMMDARSLESLANSLREGSLTRSLGKNGSGMHGKGPGSGYYGSGGPSVAMKDPGATTPRLIATGKTQQPGGKSKTGSAEEFAKYLAMSSSSPHHLPNGKIAGTRNEGGNELHMSMTGDPQAARSSQPYYQVVQASKRQAESALDKENIPAALKKQVKDYFELTAEGTVSKP